jgi:hypothetical protein
MPARALLLLTIAGGLLAACATPAPPPPPPPPPPPMMPPPPPQTIVTYSCTNGEQLEVRYFPNQGVASVTRGGKSMELQQQGELFVGPGVIIRPQQDRMRITVSEGDRSANCTAVN